MGCGASAPAPDAGEKPPKRLSTDSPSSGKRPMPPVATVGEGGGSGGGGGGGSSSGSRGTPPRGATRDPKRLGTVDIIKLCQASHFDRTQVERLYELFQDIGNGADGISSADFHTAVLHGMKSNVLVDRVFALFDSDGDGSLSFSEFLLGLSVFTQRASASEKARFSYRIFDFRGKGFIDADALHELLVLVTAESGLRLERHAMQRIVDDTFDEISTETPGRLTVAEYELLTRKKPQLLDFMTIPHMEKFLYASFSSAMPAPRTSSPLVPGSPVGSFKDPRSPPKARGPLSAGGSQPHAQSPHGSNTPSMKRRSHSRSRPREERGERSPRPQQLVLD